MMLLRVTVVENGCLLLVEALKLKFEEFTGDPAEDAKLSRGCIAHKDLNLLLLSNAHVECNSAMKKVT